MAADNAREALRWCGLKWLADTGKTQQALEELQEELDLPALPRRIECYDISNIMGTARRSAAWSSSSTGSRGPPSTAASASRRSRARTTSR